MIQRGTIRLLVPELSTCRAQWVSTVEHELAGVDATGPQGGPKPFFITYVANFSAHRASPLCG
jgi:hypothetical protein